MVIIPFAGLEKETLQAVLEEIVTRDGTDYGAVEIALERKIQQVMQQLSSGRICLCFDAETQTCSLLPADEARLLAE